MNMLCLEALPQWSEKSILFNLIPTGRHHWGHFQQTETPSPASRIYCSINSSWFRYLVNVSCTLKSCAILQCISFWELKALYKELDALESDFLTSSMKFGYWRSCHDLNWPIPVLLLWLRHLLCHILLAVHLRQQWRTPAFCEHSWTGTASAALKTSRFAPWASLKGGKGHTYAEQSEGKRKLTPHGLTTGGCELTGNCSLWFSNVNMHNNYLKSLLKYSILTPSPSDVLILEVKLGVLNLHV